MYQLITNSFMKYLEVDRYILYYNNKNYNHCKKRTVSLTYSMSFWLQVSE